MDKPPNLTDLIQNAHAGDERALGSLFDAMYPELRRMAHQRLTSGGRGTLLNTTALVHEAYMRFARTGQLRVEDRKHFVRYAGHVMRSVIVDFVRGRVAERRGGGVPAVTLNTGIMPGPDRGEKEILAVHEALEELGQFDERMVQVVELRYFAGMTEKEIGEVLGVAERTVRRDWEKARLLLAEALM